MKGKYRIVLVVLVSLARAYAYLVPLRFASEVSGYGASWLGLVCVSVWLSVVTFGRSVWVMGAIESPLGYEKESGRGGRVRVMLDEMLTRGRG